jgi:hypothetical protein
MFRRPLDIETGEVRNVDGFIYTDLVPRRAMMSL